MNTRVDIKNFLQKTRLLKPIAFFRDEYPLDLPLDEIAGIIKLDQILKFEYHAYEPSDELNSVLDKWVKNSKIEKISLNYEIYEHGIVCRFRYRVLKKDLLINKKIFLEKHTIFDNRVFYDM